MIKENNKHSVLPKGNGMENNEYMSHEVSYWWLKENPKYNINWFDLQGSGKVSAENTKYAEHYTSYGYSFRIYGYFAEILK